MILVMSHMRSASTALCNVLCSHSDISGYGETHVFHGDRFPAGRVAVNLMRRRSFDQSAPFLLDKILHNHLDAGVAAEFYKARAIFLVREPATAIASIVHLSRKAGMPQTASPELAADYYVQRVKRLLELWDLFPHERRFALPSESLLSQPEGALAELGTWLNLSKPLENSYRPNPVSSTNGAGDPLYSAAASRIECRNAKSQPATLDELSSETAGRCIEAHHQLLSQFEMVGG